MKKEKTIYKGFGMFLVLDGEGDYLDAKLLTT